MKYPKTFHLPTSLGISNDDKVLKDISPLIKKKLVCTEKLDGENTNMTNSGIHARSETSSFHSSQSWVRKFHGTICWLIPDEIQIVGENMYAKHSIFYDKLTSYFFIFAAIDVKKQLFLSVDETLEYCKELGTPFVPILYRGDYEVKFKIPEKSAFGNEIEGYVVRNEDEFPVSEMDKNIAKWVRKGHVQTDEHWTKTWVPNKLK